ncbi:hypothetical protein JSO19_09085 [Leucobacter sp. UCMA 4100]|uniref:hypothetical protein n=1 Tax=Leucobacter sp. UCMA 4100 TaxID=2810534 RepID=UPI0022EA8411|nr:hypothetical protein [Leucobacter sp. UCMA 4100]MDA3147534.1 hypothetical protein [Leucobacter sp. UCMA 4100]
MLRLLTFIGIGLGLGGLVVQVVGPPAGAVWAIPVGLCVTVLCGTLLLVARSATAVAVPSPKTVLAAKQAGRVGCARIDSLQQTGTQINDQPVCVLTLTVQPRDAAAYRTETRRVVRVTDVPRYQPGSVHEVAVLADGEPDVALLDDSALHDELGQLAVPDASAAGPVRVPGKEQLTPEGKRTQPLLGTGAKGRPWRIGLYALALLAAAALVILPYREGAMNTIEAWQRGEATADVMQPATLERAIEALTGETGHDNAVSVVVTHDYVHYTAPVAAGSQDTDVWIYRGGVVSHEGPASIQPETAGEQFSVRDIAWAALLPGAEKAASDAGLDDLTSLSMYLNRGFIEVDDETGPSLEKSGAVEIGGSLETDYRKYSVAFAGDGSGEVTLTEQ